MARMPYCASRSAVAGPIAATQQRPSVRASKPDWLKASKKASAALTLVNATQSNFSPACAAWPKCRGAALHWSKSTPSPPLPPAPPVILAVPKPRLPVR